MKFAVVAAVVLALAMGVQSSVIPLGLGLGLGHRVEVAGNGLSYTAVSGPALVPQVVAVNPWGAHVAIAAPAAVAVHAAPAVAVAAPALAVAPHGATYVAKTRGAAHVAPLDGHINSVSSVNVAPAPGTW